MSNRYSEDELHDELDKAQIAIGDMSKEIVELSNEVNNLNKENEEYVAEIYRQQSIIDNAKKMIKWYEDRYGTYQTHMLR